MTNTQGPAENRHVLDDKLGRWSCLSLVHDAIELAVIRIGLEIGAAKIICPKEWYRQKKLMHKDVRCIR